MVRNFSNHPSKFIACEHWSPPPSFYNFCYLSLNPKNCSSARGWSYEYKTEYKLVSLELLAEYHLLLLFPVGYIFSFPNLNPMSASWNSASWVLCPCISPSACTLDSLHLQLLLLLSGLSLYYINPLTALFLIFIYWFFSLYLDFVIISILLWNKSIFVDGITTYLPFILYQTQLTVTDTVVRH